MGISITYCLATFLVLEEIEVTEAGTEGIGGMIVSLS